MIRRLAQPIRYNFLSHKSRLACSPLVTGDSRLRRLKSWVGPLKDRAHLSTFKFFILEKFSCIVVLVVFFVIVQSSGLTSVWFREKMTFFLNFISFHIFAIYVGGACWGLPAACRLIAVSGARLPSVDGLTVRYIKNAPLLNLPSKYVCDLFQTCYRYMYVWYKHTGTLPLCLQVALSFIWLD